jgi:hypothetical protein
MPMPPTGRDGDLLHQFAVRLTVVEVAVAALIRAAPAPERAAALFALATLETMQLDDRSGLTAPPGIGEYLRKAIGSLGTQAIGSDWREYASSPHSSGERDH